RDPAALAVDQQQVGIVKLWASPGTLPREAHAERLEVAPPGNPSGMRLGAIPRVHRALGDYLPERAKRAPVRGQPEPGHTDIVGDVQVALGRRKLAADQLETPALDAVVGWIAVEESLPIHQPRLYERPQPP